MPHAESCYRNCRIACSSLRKFHSYAYPAEIAAWDGNESCSNRSSKYKSASQVSTPTTLEGTLSRKDSSLPVWRKLPCDCSRLLNCDHHLVQSILFRWTSNCCDSLYVIVYIPTSNQQCIQRAAWLFSCDTMGTEELIKSEVHSGQRSFGQQIDVSHFIIRNHNNSTLSGMT